MSGDELARPFYPEFADGVLAQLADGEDDLVTKMAYTSVLQARELARTRRLAEQNAMRLTKVEADVNQLVYNNDHYCTVIGFCRLIGKRNVGREEAADLGRRLRRYAREGHFDEPSREIFDPLYGTINAWHLDLLNDFFGTSVPYPQGGGSVR